MKAGNEVGIWQRLRGTPKTEARNNAATALPGFPLIPGNYSHVDGGQIYNAEQAVAVRSTIQLIANVCSELPFDVFTGKGSKKREVARPAYMDDLSGDGYGTPDWIKQWVYSTAYRGNAYGAVLDRSPTGFLRQVSLWHPDQVTAQDDYRGGYDWFINGVKAEQRELKHWRMNPIPGQLLGQSPIRAASTTIATSVAANRFGKDWFDNGSHPTGILKNTRADLKPEQSDGVKRRFLQALRGSSERGEPIVLGQSWEWQGIQVTPEDAQFLETLGATSAECCRIFGPGFAEILGYPTGTPMTYANVQDRDIQLLKYGINPWLRELERVLSAFLPSPQHVIINRDALLQTNTLARYQAYQIALGKPWLELNEVRALEDLPEIEEPEPEPAPVIVAAPAGAPETDPTNPEVPAP